MGINEISCIEEKNMDKLLLKDILKNPQAYTSEPITVYGWVRTVRDSKAFGFIELNDGTAFNNLQIVFERDRIDNYDEVSHVGTGSSIIITGQLVLTPEAKQPCELKADCIKIEGTVAADYPLQKKRHSVEFLRTLPHIRQRTNLLSAVYRIRSLAAYAIHSFFNENGFVYVNTPILTGNDCEGAGEMFQVTTMDLNNIPKTEDGKVDYSQDFFGKAVNLTVSGQLMGESYALAFRNIYTFGPTFRAEKSYTSRHAAEFWMIEPEMAFADLNDNMAVAQAMIKYIVSYVLEQAPAEIEFFNKFVDNTLMERLHNLVEADFKHITYTEAVDLLLKSGKKFDNKVEWGIDLQTEHERYITEEVFGCPVFVTDYPKDIKAFYMKQNEDGKTVAAMDLLVPGVGEIIGGSEREADYEKLLARMQELGMEIDSYQWYLDLRRFGSAYHSGYGLGFERLIMYITGVQNIRDVLPFPRTTGSCDL